MLQLPPMLRVETEAQGRFVSSTMDIWTHPALGLWAVPVGCASLPLGQQSCHICPFPSSQLSSSRPGHLRLLPHHSPSVFYAALRRRPSPLYPGLIRTGLRLTECPEAWSASVGVWAPEGEKALLSSRERSGRGRGLKDQAALADCDHRCHGNQVTWPGSPNQEVRPCSG